MGGWPEESQLVGSTRGRRKDDENGGRWPLLTRKSISQRDGNREAMKGNIEDVLTRGLRGIFRQQGGKLKALA